MDKKKNLNEIKCLRMKLKKRIKKKIKITIKKWGPNWIKTTKWNKTLRDKIEKQINFKKY
jgi:hypothetical protein